MSLVNRMLLDLEDRQSLPEGQPALAGLSSVDYCSEEGRRHRHAAARAVPVIVAVLAATLAWTFGADWSGRPAPAIPVSVSSVVESAPAVAEAPGVVPVEMPATAPAIELSLRLDDTLLSLARAEAEESASAPQPLSGALPATDPEGRRTLRGLELSTSTGNAVLDIQLDGEVRHLAYPLDHPSRIVIELRDTRLGGDLPQLEPAGAVQRVRGREERGKTILIMDLSRSVAKVQTELSERDGGTRLRVIAGFDDGLVVEDPPVALVIEPGQLTRTPASAGTLFGNAQTLCGSGRVAACLGKLTELLSHEPGHVAGRLLLATTLMNNGDPVRAAATLDEGLAIRADAWQLAQLRAQLALNAGDEELALSALLSAAPAVTEHPEYHALLAAVQQRTGRHADAADTYQRVLAQRPDHGVWWMGLGISLQFLARNRDAGVAYVRALEDASLSPDLRRFVESRRGTLSAGGGP